MACRNHPEIVEVARCARCGTECCADCLVTLAGSPLCGSCKGDEVRRVLRGEVVDGIGREPSPWEQTRSLATLLRTTKLVLTEPTRFFGTLRPQGPGALWYAVAIGWPCTALGVAVGRLTGMDVMDVTPSLAEMVRNVLIAMVVLAPLQIVFGIVVYGAFAHLFLRMFGAAHAKLETTIRTVAYGHALMVVSWVPLLGPVVGTLWGTVILAIGLKQMHGTSYGRVIAALFVPAAVGIVVVAFALAGAVATFSPTEP